MVALQQIRLQQAKLEHLISVVCRNLVTWIGYLKSKIRVRIKPTQTVAQLSHRTKWLSLSLALEISSPLLVS